MKQNSDYKNEALAALKGNWPQGVLAFLVLLLIETVFLGPYLYYYFNLMLSPADLSLQSTALKAEAFGYLFIALIAMPLTVGIVISFRKLLVERDGQITANSFKYGFTKYLRNFTGYILRYIYTFLWSLLLIIPGIIKALSYSMTLYILEDYPELSVNQAINLSMEMMKGRKYDLFYLYLSFIGWYLLSILTLGIGLLWLFPYTYTAQAAFYQDVKADYLAKKRFAEAGASAAPASQALAAPVAQAPAAPAEQSSVSPYAPAAQSEDEKPETTKSGPRDENPEDYMPK